MIVPAITLALALAVVLGIWSLCWQMEVARRFMDEDVAYRVRVLQRVPLPTGAEMDEATLVLARLEAERLGGQIETRTTCTCGNRGICLTCQLAELSLTPDGTLDLLGRRLLDDADRAHNLLENALPGQHLFLPDPLPVEHVGLRVVR